MSQSATQSPLSNPLEEEWQPSNNVFRFDSLNLATVQRSCAEHRGHKTPPRLLQTRPVSGDSCSAANAGGAATSLNRSPVGVFPATVALASHVKPRQRLILTLNIAVGRTEPRVTPAFNCNHGWLVVFFFLVSLNDKMHRLVMDFPHASRCLREALLLLLLLLHNCRCRTGLHPAARLKRAADERRAEARSIFGWMIYRRLNVHGRRD